MIELETVFDDERIKKFIAGLLEYCENKDIHSTLNVTFSEVLASVIDIIKNAQERIS